MNEINSAVKSYLDFIEASRKAGWDRVKTFRDYTAGDQDKLMTDDQKILLVGADSNGKPNSDPEFHINICPVIINALVNRLKFTSVSVKGTDDERSERFTELAQQWFSKNELGENQRNLYKMAVRDGDAYAIVGYDYEDGYPTITPNDTYDGDAGTEMAYRDKEPNKPLYAIKIWEMERPRVNNLITAKMRRMDVYFDNRIEYYISSESVRSPGSWMPLSTKDEDWKDTMIEGTVQYDSVNRPYTATVNYLTSDGTEFGQSVGNPVKHVRFDADGAYGTSRIAPIAPQLQNSVNRSGHSLQAGQLLSGFRELIITGWYPRQEKGKVVNRLKRSPSGIHYIDNDKASVTQTDATDLIQLISTLDRFVILCATLTTTPLSFFNLSGIIPAEGTQRQLEAELTVVAQTFIQTLTTVWTKIFKEMFKFEALYGDEIPESDFDLISDLAFTFEWEPTQSYSEIERREIARIDLNDLKVPRQKIWTRFFTKAEIDEMESMTLEKRNLMNAILGEALLAGDETENTAQPAVEQLPGALESDKGLNGAQITAAIQILDNVRIGALPSSVGETLLIAMGIDQGEAASMVKDIDNAKTNIQTDSKSGQGNRSNE